jgi:pteridine reductase
VSGVRPVALVTGAAQRLGQAIAVALGRAGYDVVVHHQRSAPTETLALLEGAGARGWALQADLADADAAQALPGRALAAAGRLDLVVQAAGLWRPRALAQVTPDDWDAVQAVQLRAPFFVSVAAAPLLPDGGSIVLLGDHLANESSPGLVPHSISKAGVHALTAQLAQRLAPRLRVNAVAPGAVLPPPDWPEAARARYVASTPLAAVGRPADVTDAVLYLLRAPYVTGVVLPVDGGRHLGR